MRLNPLGYLSQGKARPGGGCWRPSSTHAGPRLCVSRSPRFGVIGASFLAVLASRATKRQIRREI